MSPFCNLQRAYSLTQEYLEWTKRAEPGREYEGHIKGRDYMGHV